MKLLEIKANIEEAKRQCNIKALDFWFGELIKEERNARYNN